MKKLFFLMITIMLFSSCTKDEGKGGSGAIKGKIFIKDYDSEGVLKDEYYATEFSVYIIYGDGDFYDDEVKTHSDGSYLFNYLYPGEYTIFAYSKCKNCPGEKEVIEKTLILTKGELVSVEDLVIID